MEVNLNTSNEKKLCNLGQKCLALISDFLTMVDKNYQDATNDRPTLGNILNQRLLKQQLVISYQMGSKVHLYHTTFKNIISYQRALKMLNIDKNMFGFNASVCQSQYIHTAIAVSCPNIEIATFRSEVFGDLLFEVMQKYMIKLHTIKIIKDDMNFTFSRFKTIEKMQSIVCKAHLLNFKKLLDIIKESSETLTQLQLDVQECEEETLSDIISSLQSIQRLRLYHCQNLKYQQLLAKCLPINMVQFCMTKGYNLFFENILKKQKSIYLQQLDLTESRNLTNQLIMLVSQGSPNLKKVNLSWCINITGKGIKHLIKNCNKLQNLIINGLKSVTDETFEQYFPLLADFNQKYFDKVKYEIQSGKNPQVNSQKFFHQNLKNFECISSLSSLKWLQCISCNGLSDSILKLIFLRWRKITAINYYGNNMSLYCSANDDF